MNRYLVLPLIALAFVAGACSSNVASSFKVNQPVAAVPAGTLKTAWGDLPSYRAAGSEFPFDLKSIRGPLANVADLEAGGTALLDVLVNPDGSIRDVKVVQSSGNAAVDRFAVNSFVGARSLLIVDATGAAPYVVRQIYKLETSSTTYPGTGLGSNSRNEENRYADMHPMGSGQKLASDKN